MLVVIYEDRKNHCIKKKAWEQWVILHHINNRSEKYIKLYLRCVMVKNNENKN
jgi:hypothetical protein